MPLTLQQTVGANRDRRAVSTLSPKRGGGAPVAPRWCLPPVPPGLSADARARKNLWGGYEIALATGRAAPPIDEPGRENTRGDYSRDREDDVADH